MNKVYILMRVAEDEDGAYHDIVGVFASELLAFKGINASMKRLGNVHEDVHLDDYHIKEFSLRETELQAQVINEMDNLCIICEAEEM